VPEHAILGVEAPLWAETLGTVHDYEYMALPRLAGVAELGWSAPERRGWEDYRRRLKEHWPRWQALGLNAYLAPELR
jgi:hexosaminidase